MDGGFICDRMPLISREQAFLAAKLLDRIFGRDPMETIEELRSTFSFTKACVRSWENSRDLRSRGIRGKTLLRHADDLELGDMPPSLANISKNYTILKGFTSHMAETGVICTRLIDPLKSPLEAFYDLMEVDAKSAQAISIIHGCASIIKQMLGMLRRKWQRWEMPRVPQIKRQFFLYTFETMKAYFLCVIWVHAHGKLRIPRSRTLFWTLLKLFTRLPTTLAYAWIND